MTHPDLPRLDASAQLKRFGLRADKRLGQNFLEDPFALETIVAVSEIQPSDSVLEIGPGLGSLTCYLCASAQQVIAVELDEKLIPVLREATRPFHNIRVIQGDILKLRLEELGLPPDCLVVANIPYHITSAIIRHLLESRPKPRRIVLTVQKEVAERICASPPDMSILALSVQVYGRATVVARIASSAFFPVPKVDSAVVKIETFSDPLIPPGLLPAFFKLIKAGFSQKRKTLRNALSAGLAVSPREAETLLGKSGIDSRRRAETLELEEWKKLVSQI